MDSGSIFRSRRYRQRARAKVLFFRCLVAALLIATFITKVRSIASLQPIAQGLLITAALMLPVALIALYMRSQAKTQGKARSTEQADKDAALRTAADNNSFAASSSTF